MVLILVNFEQQLVMLRCFLIFHVNLHNAHISSFHVNLHNAHISSLHVNLHNAHISSWSIRYWFQMRWKKEHGTKNKFCTGITKQLQNLSKTPHYFIGFLNSTITWHVSTAIVCIGLSVTTVVTYCTSVLCVQRGCQLCTPPPLHFIQCPTPPHTRVHYKLGQIFFKIFFNLFCLWTVIISQFTVLRKPHILIYF